MAAEACASLVLSRVCTGVRGAPGVSWYLTLVRVKMRGWVALLGLACGWVAGVAVFVAFFVVEISWVWGVFSFSCCLGYVSYGFLFVFFFSFLFFQFPLSLGVFNSLIQC